MSVLPFPKRSTRPARPLEPRVGEGADWSEPELIDRLIAGDPAAFDEVIQHLWTPLTAYASRILDDEEAAKDVVQSALIRLWEGRAQLRFGSLRGYLLRLTRNGSLDELKRRRVRQRSALEIDLDGGLSRTTRTPAELVDEHELSTIVDRAIQALPPRRREVFTLVYLRGLSYHEVADMLDISFKTVGNQMTAALAALRAALRPFLSDSDKEGVGAAE